MDGICDFASSINSGEDHSWFVWKGEEPAPLAEISPTYRLRYSHEHGYRFDKQVMRMSMCQG